MIKFKITCYPETGCEETLTVEIGKMSEIFPRDRNYDPEKYFGFIIKSDRPGTRGISHMGLRSMHKAQATAMLRAVSYGNGGFPLEGMIR